MTLKLDHLRLGPGQNREEIFARVREVGLYEFADLGPGPCHYQLTGPDRRPVVVFVHGFSVPSYIFDPTVSALTGAGRRVLRFDLYGRGFSARPKTAYNPALFDRQLTELLSFLKIKGPVDLIGLSMGGVVCANFAVQHPDSVRRIVFLDPAGFSPLLGWKDRLKLLPPFGEIYWKGWGEKMLVNGLNHDLTQPEAFPVYHRSLKPQMAFRGFKRALLSSQREGMLDAKHFLYQRLAPIAGRIMLVWGRQDQVIPVADASTAEKLIPGLAVHLIDRAGHIPHYERPQQVNPLLLDFLA